MPYYVRTIRTRRHQARKRRVHLAGRILGILLFALVAGGMVRAFSVYVIESPRFQVKNIRVMGANFLKEEAVINAAGIHTGDNLLMSDSERIRSQVEKVPYVRRCEVQRVYPDMVIVIHVEERCPVATLLVNSRAFELDAEGMALRELELRDHPVGPLITNIPGVEVVELGQKIDNPSLKAALQVWEAFQTDPLADELNMSEISAPSPNEIATYFDEVAFEVRWGRGDFKREARNFDILWHEKGGKMPCAEYLDLRFDDDVVCR